MRRGVAIVLPLLPRTMKLQLIIILRKIRTLAYELEKSTVMPNVLSRHDFMSTPTQPSLLLMDGMYTNSKKQAFSEVPTTITP
jgi:hypothetical protein